MAQTTAIVPFDPKNYQLFLASKQEITDLAKGLRGIKIGDLDRIKVPSGGQMIWMIPSPDGEIPDKVVRGVIIFWKEGYLYWRKPISEGGGGQPPDCVSNDCERGFGIRFEQEEENGPAWHSCCGDPLKGIAPCPLSQFGSEPRFHRAKACKNVLMVFMLRPESMIPAVLIIPPTSLRPVRQYLYRLQGARTPPMSVETEWSLVEAKNQTGTAFAKAIPRKVSSLSNADVEQIRLLADTLVPLFTSVSVVDMAGEQSAMGGAEESP